MPEFEMRSEIGHPPERIFAWHTRPGALLRLFPPWWSVRVVAGSAEGLSPGDRVVLSIGKGPIRLTCESERSVVDPVGRIVDRQVRGPFAHWRHSHRIEPANGDRATLVDTVEWAPARGLIGAALGRARVERELRRLFEFRARRIEGDLSLAARYGPGEGARVAVTGSTGLIGTALSAQLEAAGYRVLRISRSRAPAGRGPGWLRWDPGSGHLPPEPLEGTTAVIHLAGETVAGLRWTAAKKRAILESREHGTLLLSRTLAGLAAPPPVLLSASAVGYYGDRGEERLTEASGAGGGFLAEVCRRWEAATRPAGERGIRTVHMRTGLVLSPAGGPLAALLLPFSLGVGGRIGSGHQFLSWIDLDDHTALMFHAMAVPGLEGAVNAVSPAPLTNAAFTDVLGRVLGRPTLLPVPRLALRGVGGQMGEELLLSGQRAVPEKALRSGFEFRYPDVELSLRHQLGRRERS